MKVLQSIRSLFLLLVFCTPLCRAVCGWAQVWPKSVGEDAGKEEMRINLCWLLVRDPAHPEGPGRWVRMLQGTEGCAAAQGRQETQLSPARTCIRPMIRAGDVLLVEETSDILDAHLEATALEPAFKGAMFRVRLRVNSKPVWVRAVDSKHAELVGAERRMP